MHIDTNLFFKALGYVLVHANKKEEKRGAGAYRAVASRIESFCRKSTPEAFVELPLFSEEDLSSSRIDHLIESFKSVEDIKDKKDLLQLDRRYLLMMHKQLEERANARMRHHLPDELLKILIVALMDAEKKAESEVA
jgi:hypothetical protein